MRERNVNVQLYPYVVSIVVIIYVLLYINRESEKVYFI